MIRLVDARRCPKLHENFCDMTISVENVENVKVKEALRAFSDTAMKSILQHLGDGSDLSGVSVPLVVGKMSFKEREELEDILEKAGGWIPLCGDKWLLVLAPAAGMKNLEKTQKEYLYKTGRYCITCGVFTEYRDVDNQWVCPQCLRSVGCYTDSMLPMGCIATRVERNHRISTHRLVDALWKEGLINRRDVYKEIAQVLNLPKPYAHIAMMNEQQLNIVDVWAQARYKQLKSEFNSEFKERTKV